MKKICIKKIFITKAGLPFYEMINVSDSFLFITPISFIIHWIKKKPRVHEKIKLLREYYHHSFCMNLADVGNDTKKEDKRHENIIKLSDNIFIIDD